MLRSLPSVRAPYVIVTGLLILSSSLLAGCTRDEGSRAAPASLAILESSVLQQLPETATAFAVTDFASSAYTRYRKSPWNEVMKSDPLQQLSELAERPEMQEFLPIVEALRESKLLQGEDPAAAQMLIFAGVHEAEKHLDLGVLLTAASGKNLQSSLSLLPEALRAVNEQKTDIHLTETPEEIEGAQAFRIEVRRAGGVAQAPELTLYMGANEQRLAVVSQKALLVQLLEGTPTARLQALRATPRFTKATTNLPLSGELLSFGYVDIAATLAQAATALQTTGPEEFASAKELPLESAAWGSSFDETYGVGVKVVLEPRDDAQRQSLAMLAKGSEHNLLGRMPGGTVAALAIDGTLVKSIKDNILGHLAQDPQQALPPGAELIDQLKGLALALRPSAGGSPFPEVMLALAHREPKQVASVIETQINALIASGQAPITPLQKKQVEGVETSYLMSPLGVGAFLGVLNDLLVVTTSEPALASFVRAQGDGLMAGLPARARAVLQGSPLLSAYVNFQEGIALLESVQGSFAMFTGGQPLIDEQQLAPFRKLWMNVSSVRLADQALLIESRYLLPEQRR